MTQDLAEAMRKYREHLTTREHHEPLAATGMCETCRVLLAAIGKAQGEMILASAKKTGAVQ